MTPKQERALLQRKAIKLHRQAVSFICQYGKGTGIRKPSTNQGWFHIYAKARLLKEEIIENFDSLIDYYQVLDNYVSDHIPKKDRPRFKKDHDKQNRKDFYLTWEWKELRMKALKLHGRQCLCCGFIPFKGSKNYIVVDHIKPISKFPMLKMEITNLQTLCNDCNMGKSNVHYDDYR